MRPERYRRLVGTCYSIPMERKSISEVADIVGVNRNTLARWIKDGKLKSSRGRVRNLQTKLVDVDEARALAADCRPGRPRKDG